MLYLMFSGSFMISLRVFINPDNWFGNYSARVTESVIRQHSPRVADFFLPQDPFRICSFVAIY